MAAATEALLLTSEDGERNADITETEGVPSTTIFDLYSQVIKRILSYLDDRDLDNLERTCEKFKRIVDEFRKYSLTEYKEDFENLHLMDLPSEVHGKILGFCHSDDRPNLRLVSKLMQYQVDTLAGVTVNLNDWKWQWSPPPGTKRLPPASTLIVINVENIHSVKYFASEYNSKLLTRLLLDGPFPAKGMILILKQCINLRYIGLTHALLMSSLEDEFRKSFPSKRLPLRLSSLKAINLKMREKDMPFLNVFRVHSWTWTNAFEFMRPSLFVMPNLSSFYICEDSIFSHNLIFEVAEKVLKFIVQYRHTLKYISVILLGSCSRTCVCPPYHSEVPDELLKQLKLLDYSHDCDWRISRPFTIILSAQNSLRKLTCFNLTDWEYYAGVIRENCRTLNSLTIEKNLVRVIDLGVLDTCERLEFLSISQHQPTNPSQLGYKDSFNNGAMRFDQRLINLDKLPLSLKILHILDQTTETSQIQSIPRRLKNLEKLELQFLGSWNRKEFGLSARTILEIIQLRKLNCVFLEEIKTHGVWCSEPEIENELSKVNLIPPELSRIVNRFGHVLYGFLMAEKLPSADFLPEWHQRISSYFDTTMPLQFDCVANYTRPVNPEEIDFFGSSDNEDEEEDEEDDEEFENFSDNELNGEE